MKKKTIIFTMAFVSLIMVIGCVYFAINNRNVEDLMSTWKEFSIKDGASYAYSNINNFDLKKTITDADYVFSGTVVSRKEYQVEWIDDSETWGPFPNSVIEVRVNKEYNEKSPVNGDIVKVYYPYSLSTVFGGSFLIKDDGEYVFVTRALD